MPVNTDGHIWAKQKFTKSYFKFDSLCMAADTHHFMWEEVTITRRGQNEVQCVEKANFVWQ